MKLNPDCVRDVLLYLEDKLEYVDRYDTAVQRNKIEINRIAKDLHTKYGYEENDVNYATELLLEAHYIKSDKITQGADGAVFRCPINGITWEGHKLLESIRPKSIWEATKQGASKLGIMSVHALSTIAMSVTQAVITDPSVIGKIVSMLG